MLIWLKMNLGTILVALVLLAVVALIVAGMVRKKKRGEGLCGCGCGCADCPSRGQCHTKT